MSQVTRTSRHGGRYWLRMLGWSIAAAVAVVALFSGATWRTPWRQLVEPFTIAMVFTASIVPLAAFTMPRLMPVVGSRFRFPINWAVLIVVMIVIGLTGSSIAIVMLRVVGYIPPGHVTEWFLQSLKQSIIMTLIFGVTISAIEAMRARLDQTTIELRTKERDEAEARRLATEAQLASLESRVNPHFLFNTLNSIAALVPKDPEGAERMTGQLASLMRSSLDTARSPLVVLEDEVKVVRDYLEIERVRFGERLRYSITLDESTRNTPIPRLSLQTLVENSVKFAVTPRPSGATIAVRATAAGGQVLIEVQDDGPGFSGRETPDGHGLALLRSRLRMLFGDRAALGVEREDVGVRVWLAVPATRELNT